jgi:molybdate transport system regulatory protein
LGWSDLGWSDPGWLDSDYEVVVDIGGGKTLAAHISAHSAKALQLADGLRVNALFESSHVIIAID